LAIIRLRNDTASAIASSIKSSSMAYSFYWLMIFDKPYQLNHVQRQLMTSLSLTVNWYTFHIFVLRHLIFNNFIYPFLIIYKLRTLTVGNILTYLYLFIYKLNIYQTDKRTIPIVVSPTFTILIKYIYMKYFCCKN